MEKINIENSKGYKLSGIIHKPEVETKSAIIVSHGSGATKDRPRLIKLSEALANAGFVVLRFDFGGCGENADREITVRGQVDDLKSTVAYMRNYGYDVKGLVGESLGSITSILAYDNKIKVMVLMAPVTKSKDKLSLSEKLRQELKEKGFHLVTKDGRNLKYPKEYFEERASINQKELLSKLRCPVLIIHGDEDKSIPLEWSLEAQKYLPKGSKLEIIKGGDHKLDTKVDEIIPLAVSWFKKYLK